MTDALAEAGQPTQLPRGEATAAMEATAGASTAIEAQGPPAPPSAVPAPATPAAPIPTFRPTTETEKFLFGPSTRPAESVAAGVSQAAPLPVPQAAYDMLPALQQAALSPDAPPQIQALLNLLMHHMGR